jgi:ADP-heptose:LPS heptosyltransferase
MHSDPHNILLAHIAGLTKTTLALPALHSLRRHFDRSRITIISSSAGAELLKLAGCADVVLPVGRIKQAELLNPRLLYNSAKVCGAMRRSNFDLSIEFETNLEGEIILQLAGPASGNRPDRLKRGLAGLIERAAQGLLKRPPKLIHAAHEYLKILEPLDVRPVESQPRLTTDRASDETIERLLNRGRMSAGELLIGIHPGAGPGKSRWPLERFASIARRMIHNFDARVIIFAGPSERGISKSIAETLPARRALTIESPRLSEFVSLAARLSVLVANHSGPAHVAAATGTPVVAASITSGPSAQDLLGKHHLHIRGPHVESIPEDTIYEAACSLIKTSRAEILRAR